MATGPRDKSDPIREADVQGLKYFRKLWPLFERLRDVGCERDKAGNRQLFMDQYCALVLLFLFNPCVRSLRALQQAGQLKNVQKTLGCGRASLGSLSEATDVFDPARLQAIIGELASQVPPRSADQLVRHVVTAVDGTVVKTLATIAEATYLKTKNGDGRSAWRLHTHFDVDRRIPTQVDVTSASNSGKTDEKNVLRGRLAPDHCYVMDRWYAQFTLFNEISELGSSYVCRVRDNSRYEVLEDRPLLDAARAVDVLSDQIVELGRGSPAAKRPDHPVRLVLIRCTPHEKTGGRKGGTAGPPSDGVLRIATNLIDVPAEIVAELYRRRWTIELFFRFFKHVLGCRHLLSTAQAGVEIQTYCAIIACLLLALWTAGKPTLRTYEMVCLYLQGWADQEELLAHLQKLKPQVV